MEPEAHITEVELQEFESREHTRIDQELFLHQVQLEETRLDHILTSIQKTEDAIKKTSSSRQLSNLLTKLEELKKEEKFVLERLENLAKSKVLPSVASNTSPEPKSTFDEDRIFDDKSEETQSQSSSDEHVPSTPLSSEAYCDDSIESNLRTRLETSAVTSDFLFFPLSQQTQLYTRIPCVSLQLGSLYAPTHLFERLFPYQQEGIRWLIGHFMNKSGGILGDEMGLGKTTQIIGFLASTYISGHLNNPALVVAPATLLRQWINEFHRWFPFMRILLLHNLEGSSEFKRIMNTAFDFGHVVVTSYGYLRKHSDILTRAKWKVVILDEGHGIRNPSTEVSQICRQFRCTRRFILSGTPIQNNLLELWTLMDFCQPGLLGSQFAFKTAFSDPIRIGGFVNATHLQIQAAQKCSQTLKDRIEPFLLRRVKSQVAKQLPKKTEKILLCELTPLQRSLYQDYLNSEDVHLILNKRKNVLVGIDVLRKICNHPRLLLLKQDDSHDNEEDSCEEEGELYHKTKEDPFSSSKFGSSVTSTDLESSSGKIQALHKVLKEWHEAGDRCLIFCQTRQMLDILQEAIVQWSMSFLRMDGTTPIVQRNPLIDRFNSDEQIFAFLLTTRVGGLGINLTGANRVLIFDPDWNPSTDLQARERAWRLGQTRPVTVYRMIAAGSIEEKIYQRQIYKQHLTKKILQDPNAASTLFSTSDLYNIFAPLIPTTSLGTVEVPHAPLSDDNFKEGSVIQNELLKTNNVPMEQVISKRARIFEREAEALAKTSLSMVLEDEERLRLKLKSIMQTGPKETKAIIRALDEDVDPVLLKKALTSVARFDRLSKKWTPQQQQT